MRGSLATEEDRPARANRRRATNRSSLATKVLTIGTGRKTSQIAYLCALAVGASPPSLPKVRADPGVTADLFARVRLIHFGLLESALL